MWSSLLQTIANFTGADDDAHRHFELAANRIQHALLDVVVPDFPGYDLGVCAEPAMLVGGDYIDLYPCSDDVLMFGLGDASGKSLAAALNALMLRYLVRGLAKSIGPEDLVQIIKHANDVLVEDLQDGNFITFLLGTLEVGSGLLRVANAGHEPPIVLAADADEAHTLDAHDIVLGVTKKTNYREEQYTLVAGDVALFYTDGLTEATNTQGEMFTIEGLKKELVRCRHLPAPDLAAAIFEAVKSYTEAPLRDDSTIFVARRTV